MAQAERGQPRVTTTEISAAEAQFRAPPLQMSTVLAQDAFAALRIEQMHLALVEGDADGFARLGTDPLPKDADQIVTARRRGDQCFRPGGLDDQHFGLGAIGIEPQVLGAEKHITWGGEAQ